MIIQNNDGEWMATCELCQWSTIDQNKKDVANKLRNHINMVHKTGLKGIKERKRPNSRKNLPPNLPAPIKER